jgi:hypothetical protein
MNSNPEKPNEIQTEPSSFEPKSHSSAPQDFASRTPSAINQSYMGTDPRRKSPVLAIILSAMPGLGQIYVGFYQQGFINIIVVASIIAILTRGLPNYMYPLLGLFLAFYWLYNLVDAGRRAAFYNQALDGVTDTPIPTEFKSLTERGSIIGGAALVLLGVFFLAHTKFGMPLEWLEQWWPMALVIAGLFLVYQNWSSSKEKS